MTSTLTHLDSVHNHRYIVFMTPKAMAKKLIPWFQKNQRDLPWRSTKDPYKIWISETMLQQTTSRAVIPFYHRFLEAFPTVNDLANASDGKVLENWAGLGYYSRARNLHKAAQQIADMKAFPEEVNELLKLPGFGPYTARAVASIAFEKPAGVVDGNTIRVMSRISSWNGEWWKTSGRKKIQADMDKWVQYGRPSIINQALMELGASHCSPTRPACMLCPIKKGCRTFTENKAPENFPAKKPKKSMEIWVWKPEVRTRGNKVALIKNEALPFLKGQWILPGSGQKLPSKPDSYDYTHSITHHKIYVQVQKKQKAKPSQQLTWAPREELTQWCPVSLVQKALNHK